MDIPELLQDLGIDYREFGQHHHCTQGWINVECPGCSPGTGSFKRGINLQWGNTNCWSCGPAKLADLLKEITGQSQAHLLKGISRHIDPTTPKSPRGILKVPLGLVDLLPCHIAYLKARGLPVGDLVRLWGIRGIGLHPTLAWRVWIPITFRGEVVSWTSRSLGNTGRRYINAGRDEEKMPAKSLLFGQDFVRHAAVICEGPFDAMAIGPGATATMGVAYTVEQLAKIAKIPIRVICFDNQVDAQNRARELMETLCVCPGETVNVVLESGKDAAEADKEEVKELRRRYLE